MEKDKRALPEHATKGHLVMLRIQGKTFLSHLDGNSLWLNLNQENNLPDYTWSQIMPKSNLI